MAALCGVITSNVRKVSIEAEDNSIRVFFYYNENPSEEEVELSDIAETEIIADFPKINLINSERIVIKYPEKINYNGYLIYSRFEKPPNDNENF